MLFFSENIVYILNLNFKNNLILFNPFLATGLFLYPLLIYPSILSIPPQIRLDTLFVG